MGTGKSQSFEFPLCPTLANDSVFPEAWGGCLGSPCILNPYCLQQVKPAPAHLWIHLRCHCHHHTSLFFNTPSLAWLCPGNDMRRCSLSGLDLLEGPLWSAMPPEAMLVSVVHAAAPAHDEAWGPCGHMQSVPLTDALVVTLGFAVLSHAGRSGLCSH